MRNRPMDVLYETEFVVSSAKDNLKAQMHNAYFRLDYVPDFVNYFSSLSNHPARRMRLSPNSVIPTHLDRSFRPTVGTTQTTLTSTGRVQVGGKAWSKFFKASPSCFAEKPLESSTDVVMEVKSEPKTMGVQTQYRESATQTIPFEPDLDLGSSAEEYNTKTTRRNVDLTLLKGVGPENCTVEFVELLQREEAFKKRLPPLDSEGALVQRRRMIAEKETEKWRQRETVLKKKQHRTIRAFEEELYKQEDSREANIEARTIRRFQDKSIEQSDKGRKKRTTNGVMDPETRKWLSESPKTKTCNIDSFANVCSSLYLPVPHEGKLLPKSIKVEDAREPTKVATLDLIGDKLTTEWIRSPTEEGCPKATRKMLRLERDLDVITDAIQTSARDGSRGHGPCWIALEASINATTKHEGKQNQRLIKEAIEMEQETESQAGDLNTSIVHIRRLIRGRLLQQFMIKQTKRE